MAMDSSRPPTLKGNTPPRVVLSAADDDAHGPAIMQSQPEPAGFVKPRARTTARKDALQGEPSLAANK